VFVFCKLVVSCDEDQCEGLVDAFQFLVVLWGEGVFKERVFVQH